MFIDAENQFRSNRLVEIAEGLFQNKQEVLKNVDYARAYNSENLLEMLGSK